MADLTVIRHHGSSIKDTRPDNDGTGKTNLSVGIDTDEISLVVKVYADGVLSIGTLHILPCVVFVVSDIVGIFVHKCTHPRKVFLRCNAEVKQCLLRNSHWVDRIGHCTLAGCAVCGDSPAVSVLFEDDTLSPCNMRVICLTRLSFELAKVKPSAAPVDPRRTL